MARSSWVRLSLWLSSWCWLGSWMEPSVAFVLPNAARCFLARGGGGGGVLWHSAKDFDLEAGIGVGIDLGTTNSAVAILKDGDKDGIPRILSIPHNGPTLPSVVSIVREKDATTPQVWVGQEAVEVEGQNPQGTYRHVKRVMGMGGRTAAWNADVVPNLWVRGSSSSLRSSKERTKTQMRQRRQDLLANREPLKLSQQLRDALDDPARLLLPSNDKKTNDDGENDTLSPEQVSSYIVERLLRVAEEETKRRVNRAVVGVPAYFNDAQRNATLKACELAGLEKVQLLKEPEAAALAYGVGKEQLDQQLQPSSSSNNPDDSELVLVFDLGGGTYDVSILEVGGGLMEVLATSGNNMLGGSDFDSQIAAQFLQLVQTGVTQFWAQDDAGDAGASYMDEETKRDILSPHQNYLRHGGPIADAMLRAAEAVRIALSNARVVTLALPLSASKWQSLSRATDILASDVAADTPFLQNGYYYCPYTRTQMEQACREEFEALLRPIREVAILAGALLPGDSSPSAVQAAMDLEEEPQVSFADFYNPPKDNDEEEDDSMLLQIQTLQLQKKQQQRGRKRARTVAVEERQFRREAKRAEESKSRRAAKSDPDDKSSLRRNGILGRSLSQVVLVGGATRMPAIGRLLQTMTGIRPQRTVHPDQAVALGCAVHVGILDGRSAAAGLQVLNPLQAALLRAVAQKQQAKVDGEGIPFPPPSS